MQSCQREQDSLYVEANDGAALINRGISAETQRHFLVSYDPEWRNPVTVARYDAEDRDPRQIPASPRVIIPRSQYGYFARDARDKSEIPEAHMKYAKQSIGKTSLFNAKGIAHSYVIFVTEGEIDAMSVYEVGGYTAVALCSTANTELLIRYFTDHPDHHPVCLLMLDNDGSAARKAQDKLKRKLQDAELHSPDVPYAEYNDPNEFLLAEKDGFCRTLKAAAEYASDKVFDRAVASLDQMHDFGSQIPIYEAKTGFLLFDDEHKNLYGGIHAGLYVIGAVSGEGKATLSLQICDQIAQRGKHVLCFTTEQSKKELIAKSISRETFLIGRKAEDFTLSKNYAQIINSRLYQDYSDKEKRAIKEAVSNYRAYGKRITIVDQAAISGKKPRRGRMTADYIRDTVEKYIKLSGRKPVVIVDYVQNLAFPGPYTSDKRNMDEAAYALKAIAEAYEIPVMAISSFTRNGYAEPADMTSFKESGALEYSADFLFALQKKKSRWN